MTSKRANEPKRKRPIPHRAMTAEQRVVAVVKIVGTQHRALVEWAVATADRLVEEIRSKRVSETKWRIKRPAKEFGVATQRMITLVKRAPQQWFDCASTDREHLLRQLKDLLAVCTMIHAGVDRLKPKPSADDKSKSAIASFWICFGEGPNTDKISSLLNSIVSGATLIFTLVASAPASVGFHKLRHFVNLPQVTSRPCIRRCRCSH